MSSAGLRSKAPLSRARRRFAVRLLVAAFVRRAAALRVLCYVVVVLCSSSLVLVHTARGAVGERSLALGRELETLRDMLGTTKTVTLNGQRMMLSTAVVPLDIHATLDRFERFCRRGPNALVQASDTLPGVAAANTRLPLLQRLAILRKEGAQDGMVACLTRRGESSPPLTELVEQLRSTLDIGLLGDFFYVYVRDASAADKMQSHVITSWTRGSFRPAAMFPAAGDAPGADSALAPRPASARRVLSGVAADAPYAVRIYESAQPAHAALAEFDTGMAVRGWTRMENARLPAATHAYVHRSGITALATARTANRSSNTIFSLVEMGAPSSPLEPSMVAR